MAMAIASISKLIVSPGALQASASVAHADTRSFLSARMVCSFSAGSSLFVKRGSRLQVGTLGAHGLLPSETTRMKSKRMITSASSEPQADSRQYFALTYDYVPDILEKRGPYRPGHIELAKSLEAEGKMPLGGAWGALVYGAFFIFLVNSAEGNWRMQGNCSCDDFTLNPKTTPKSKQSIAGVRLRALFSYA